VVNVPRSFENFAWRDYGSLYFENAEFVDKEFAEFGFNVLLQLGAQRTVGYEATYAAVNLVGLPEEASAAG
jgi:hypothetical protein